MKDKTIANWGHLFLIAWIVAYGTMPKWLRLIPLFVVGIYIGIIHAKWGNCIMELEQSRKVKGR